MSIPKFEAGQAVNYSPPFSRGAWIICTIVRVLPDADDEPQYRIKNEAEHYERVASESQLTLADHAELGTISSA